MDVFMREVECANCATTPVNSLQTHSSHVTKAGPGAITTPSSTPSEESCHSEGRFFAASDAPLSLRVAALFRESVRVTAQGPARRVLARKA